MLPHARLVELGERIVEVLQCELDEPRLVRLAGSPLEDGSRVIAAAGGEEEREVPRHVEHTGGKRERLAADVLGQPRPSQRAKTNSSDVCDARAETEPPGEPLRHLAHRRKRISRPHRVGERRFDDLLAHLRRAAGRDVRAVERDDLIHVGRVDEEEGGPMLDVLAEELRRLVPVRRAAGAVEERDVVGVANLVRGCAGEFGQADREHRRAQRVLERLPRAEVGRERERADELGGADRLLHVADPTLGFLDVRG